MFARGLVVLDPVGGVARLGTLSVPLTEAGTHGELRVGGPGGTLLRPISFAARWRAVTRAMAAPHPREAVCTLILRASTAQAGVGDEGVLQTLALALAGAGDAAMPFTDMALLVARAAGLELRALDDLEATAVDQLAMRVAPAQLEEEWYRIEFTPPAGLAVDDLRASLADAMLARGESAPESHDAGVPSRRADDVGVADRLLPVVPPDARTPGSTSPRPIDSDRDSIDAGRPSEPGPAIETAPAPRRRRLAAPALTRARWRVLDEPGTSTDPRLPRLPRARWRSHGLENDGEVDPPAPRTATWSESAAVLPHPGTAALPAPTTTLPMHAPSPMERTPSPLADAELWPDAGADRSDGIDAVDAADALADLLEQEADARGLDP